MVKNKSVSLQTEKFFVHAFFILFDDLAKVPTEEEMFEMGTQVSEALSTGYSYWLHYSPFARTERFTDTERKLKAFKKGFNKKET